MFINYVMMYMSSIFVSGAESQIPTATSPKQPDATISTSAPNRS